MSLHEWEPAGARSLWRCSRCRCKVLWDNQAPPADLRAEYFDAAEGDLKMDCDERVAFNVLRS